MINSLMDEQLMQQVKYGDLNSLSPLFEKYHVKLYNFFLRMTRNQQISEDLTQDVFRRIIHYRESFNANYGFRSWMYQIARNVLNKYFNENRMLTEDYSQVEQVIDVSNNVPDLLEQNYKHELLYDALSKLSVEQREIIELSRFQGLKYEEISELTGNSVSAIKVKMHRAIKKLREIYFQLA